MVEHCINIGFLAYQPMVRVHFFHPVIEWMVGKEVPDMDQIKIGRFIASCRKEAGMTQAVLAEKLGIKYA